MNKNRSSWIATARALPQRYPKTTRAFKLAKTAIFLGAVGYLVNQQNNRIANLEQVAATTSHVVYALDDLATIKYAISTDQKAAVKIICKTGYEFAPIDPNSGSSVATISQTIDQLFSDTRVGEKLIRNRTCRVQRPFELD